MLHIRGKKNRSQGFTLVELLIAMGVGTVVLAALSNVLIMQNESHSVQEQVAEMQQNGRAAIEMICRELRQAGCDPGGSATTAGIATAGSNSITFRQDLNGDGDTSDADESITYSLYTESGVQKLGRDTGSGNVAVAENIDSLSFSYWDGSGVVTATLANIREIRIVAVSETAEPDPNYTVNGGYRTYTLTSRVTPRNLAL